MVALLGVANHLKVQQAPFSLDPFVATAMVTVVLPCSAVAAVLLSQLLSAGRPAPARPPAVGSGS